MHHRLFPKAHLLHKHHHLRKLAAQVLFLFWLDKRRAPYVLYTNKEDALRLVNLEIEKEVTKNDTTT